MESGFTGYLWLGQGLVWLALLSAALRPLPVGRRTRWAVVALFLALPLFAGHPALFYLAGWLGMASVPTLAVALYSLARDGKQPLPTRYWLTLAIINAVVIVPFLIWPVNGYEWGYQTQAGLALVAIALVMLWQRQTALFWLVAVTTLIWLVWPGTSRNAFNYVADGMMLFAAPCVLLTRAIRAGVRFLRAQQT